MGIMIACNHRGVNSVGEPERQLQDFVLRLPQIVPESWCLQCKICCRFPAPEKVQTPFWSPMEARWAEQKVEGARSWFNPAGDPPSLSASLVPCGGAYHCPAFESETNRCKIHSVKPLDCRLYPFVLTRNPGGTQVLLAMDPKCPFIEQKGKDPELLAYATQMVEYLETPIGRKYLEQNPEIAGPLWPEYLAVAALPGATDWIQSASRSSHPPHPDLRAVTQEDLPALWEVLGSRPHRISHYMPASLLGWRDLIGLWRMSEEEGFTLFASQAGALFLPVPPLGSPLSSDRIEKSWRILQEVNQGEQVSRIEGIEEADEALFRRMGFSLRKEEEEYLYDSDALAHLRGDRYRSQRWAVNRCSKSLSFKIRPFREEDLRPCLQLYTRWAIRKQQKDPDEMERRLIRDNLFYHRRLMMDPDCLQLSGRVLESEGKILGYTFGGAISSEVFCVLLEIADENVPGLAQTLFREFSREIHARGYRWVNGMGDSGLPGLQRAKRAYRPVEKPAVFTAYQRIKPRSNEREIVELKGIEPSASTVRL